MKFKLYVLWKLSLDFILGPWLIQYLPGSAFNNYDFKKIKIQDFGEIIKVYLTSKNYTLIIS
jgi:hypothetical protein